MSGKKPFKAGFVAISGRPNVGKSTLINGLVGESIAITSPKPQTTRHLIRGVYDDEEAQIVFVDAPGINRPKFQLDRQMQKTASLAIEEGDLILLLIDARFKPYVDRVERRVTNRAKESGKPIILVINKVDIAKKDRILPLIAAFNEYHTYDAIVPISAKTGEGYGVLLNEMKRLLPEGEPFFNDGQFTDQTERTLAAEIIRSEVLNQTREEIPHGVAIDIETFDETVENGERVRVLIEATIITERDSHKLILIGKHGQQIKQLGTRARGRIGDMLGCPCDLKLYVKVRDRWRDRPEQLRSLGFTEQS